MKKTSNIEKSIETFLRRRSSRWHTVKKYISKLCDEGKILGRRVHTRKNVWRIGVDGMKKVLVVDDDIDVGETIREILEKDGYIVGVACNGQACLEFMDKEFFSTVFLDIMMPDMDGYTISKELRKIYNGKVRIAYVSIKPRLEVDMENADLFVQKPFSIGDITKAIKVIDK